MERTLHVTRADPCGNITLFVHDNVPPEEYAEINQQLLAMPDLAGEQVGFIRPAEPSGLPRLEMAGGEFCGNASRAYGYLLAGQLGPDEGEIVIEISGCSHPVHTFVSRSRGTAYTDMPLPQRILPDYPTAAYGACPLICFEGISHLLLFNKEPDRRRVQETINRFYTQRSDPALGLIFLSDNNRQITPIVHVHSTGTQYEESSCGSGSTAAAVWLAMQDPQLEHMKLSQPVGCLELILARSGADITSIRMGGEISLGPIIPVSVTLLNS